MAKRDTILYGYQGQTLFCDPKWYKYKKNLIYYDSYSKCMYAQNLLQKTKMSWGDPFYYIKTNIDVVIKAQMGLNNSVYLAL
jgi:hypothetical protein